jgi:hypothetical protein
VDTGEILRNKRFGATGNLVFSIQDYCYFFTFRCPNCHDLHTIKIGEFEYGRGKNPYWVDRLVHERIYRCEKYNIDGGGYGDYQVTTG